MVELTGAQLDMVAGGYYNPGPGFGVLQLIISQELIHGACAHSDHHRLRQPAASSSQSSSSLRVELPLVTEIPSQFVAPRIAFRTRLSY